MNDLEDRIRTNLNAAADRLPDYQTRLAPGPTPLRRANIPGPLIAVAAMAAVTLAIGGVSFVLGGTGGEQVAASGPDASNPSTGSLVTDTSWDGSSGVVDTTLGDGAGGLCSPEVTTDTLYLGGPAWEGNAATPGFLYSLPAGPSPSDLANSFVSSALVGSGCAGYVTVAGESAVESGRTMVSLTVDPPATPATIGLEVEVVERDGVIGVAAVSGSSEFEVVTDHGQRAVVLSTLPADAKTVSVRFRKGDDMWELSSDATVGSIVTLAVPPLETDRFPDAEPEWVIVTWRADSGRVIDASATLIP